MFVINGRIHVVMGHMVRQHVGIGNTGQLPLLPSIRTGGSRHHYHRLAINNTSGTSIKAVNHVRQGNNAWAARHRQLLAS